MGSDVVAREGQLRTRVPVAFIAGFVLFRTNTFRNLRLAFSSVSSANIGYVCHLLVCFVLDTVVGLMVWYGSLLNVRGSGIYRVTQKTGTFEKPNKN